MWTAWKPLPISNQPWRFFDLKELLQGGQSFRWIFEPATKAFTGGWAGFLSRLRVSPEGSLEASFPRGGKAHLAPTERALIQYLGYSEEQTELLENLPWRSDPILREAIEQFPRLRILQQPPEEALLSFLCSATKQIPQIQQGLWQLAQRFGQPLADGWNQLPRWEVLAGIPLPDLRDTGIGFRARHIAGTADFLKENPAYLSAIASLPYPEARTALLKLPGVGTKVADCTLLFGFQKWEAFPVDTWIAKTLQRLYGLHDWKLGQLETFGRVHFGSGAGLAQQFLFARMRQLS
ncbi:MAG: DNA-binding protein [Opitutales bacterium]|nr:DNA-binding protein [Opitutales bacterium]